MKTISFGYLQKRRFLILTVILALASTLFSVTAFSFFGFYKAFNAYLGESEDIIAIYHRKGTGPFTGFIPLSLVAHVESLDGVLATSPETVTPSLIKGKSAFIRGVIPEEFSKVNQLTMLDGEALQFSDTNFMIVGRGLAKTLNLAVGDKVLILGVMSDRYLTLEIKGMYESLTTLDDEAIIPLYAGQWLRGINYDTINILRVKIDRSKTTPTQLYDIISKETQAPPQPDEETKPSPVEDIIEELIPISNVAINPEELGVKETRKLMNTYLERYGMTQETLLILSVAVFTFASATIFSATRTLVRQHRHEITVLRSLGAQTKTLKLEIAIKTLPWSILASFLGLFIAAASLLVMENRGLQAFSHTISFQPNLTIIMLSITLTLLITTISIESTKLK